MLRDGMFLSPNSFAILRVWRPKNEKNDFIHAGMVGWSGILRVIKHFLAVH